MRRHRTIKTKVIGRIRQSAAKVVLPHSIHDATPCQRVSYVGDPKCERSAAFTLRCVCCDRKMPGANVNAEIVPGFISFFGCVTCPRARRKIGRGFATVDAGTFEIARTGVNATCVYKAWSG